MLNPFLGFKEIDGSLDNYYHISMKLDSKVEHEKIAVYTKKNGGYDNKYLITSIEKQHTKTFTPEMIKQVTR